jgi:hypothetical protein
LRISFRYINVSGMGNLLAYVLQDSHQALRLGEFARSLIFTRHFDNRLGQENILHGIRQEHPIREPLAKGSCLWQGFNQLKRARVSRRIHKILGIHAPVKGKGWTNRAIIRLEQISRVAAAVAARAS